jgi:hypothetical protein
MALILSVPRRLAEGEKLVRSGQWHGWSPSGMLGHRIGGKKLGIIGSGLLGSGLMHWTLFQTGWRQLLSTLTMQNKLCLFITMVGPYVGMNGLVLILRA